MRRGLSLPDDLKAETREGYFRCTLSLGLPSFYSQLAVLKSHLWGMSAFVFTQCFIDMFGELVVQVGNVCCTSAPRREHIPKSFRKMCRIALTNLVSTHRYFPSNPWPSRLYRRDRYWSTGWISVAEIDLPTWRSERRCYSLVFQE